MSGSTDTAPRNSLINDSAHESLINCAEVLNYLSAAESAISSVHDLGDAAVNGRSRILGMVEDAVLYEAGRARRGGDASGERAP